MRWRRGQSSSDVVDARRSRALPIAGGGGIVGIIVVVLITLLGGGGGFTLPPALEQLPSAQEPAGGGGDSVPGAPDPDAELVDFVEFVLDDVQDHWERTFSAGGRTYPRARLVLFRDTVRSGCGTASSATGPFYCPLDQRAYLDLGFFRELARRFGAPGDFAQAYVLAHEIGHHVQRVLGVDAEVRRRSREDPDRRNVLSIRQELQADCFAGVWGHSTYERGLLESGDLEEGLGAAAAVGDDRIQEAATGRVDPESWTHGSAEQRTRWFRAGFESGDPDRCDTFTGDV